MGASALKGAQTTACCCRSTAGPEFYGDDVPARVGDEPVLQATPSLQQRLEALKLEKQSSLQQTIGENSAGDSSWLPDSDAMSGKPTQERLAALDNALSDDKRTNSASRSEDARSVISEGQQSCGSIRVNKKRRRRNLSVVDTMGFVPSSATQVIIDNRATIESVYELSSKNLGKGSFGTVKKGRVKATRAQRAVKTISKELMKEKVAVLKEEISIMKMVDHPNIIRLSEVFEDKDHMHIVMELCLGGSLQGRITRTGVKDVDAAVVMQQLLRAVSYVHHLHICHRDLKPENLLLSEHISALSKNQIKVSDFGVSCVMVNDDQILRSKAGTPAYMAPEVYARSYGKPCDIWSCGVIMYEMLGGAVPFKAPDEEKLAARVSNKALTFAEAGWINVKQDAMDMVSAMLTKAPDHRMTLEQALQNAFITHLVPPPASLRLSTALISQLKGFRKLNVLKRAALQVVASMLGEDDILEFRKIFLSLDADGNGCLSVEELEEKMKEQIEHKHSVKDVHHIFVDTQNQGDHLKPFSYTEFLAAAFDRKRCLTKEVLHVAFTCFDKNGDGKINMADLSSGRLLGTLSMEDLWQTFQELDRNGDTEIDFDEFSKMMVEGNT